MRGETGRLVARAFELDFGARNGRGPDLDELTPAEEASWRVVAAERQEYESEMQEDAMRQARRGK